MKWTIMAAFITLAGIGAAHSAPIEFDTPSAYIMVTRPMDSWSGDAEKFKKILAAKKEKKISFILINENGKPINGGEMIFQGVADHPITKGVEALAKNNGWSMPFNSFGRLRIMRPLTLQSEDLENLFIAQGALFQQLVNQQGNPATLQSRIASKKTSEGIVSFLGVIAGAKLLGVSSGIQMGADSKIVRSINLANSPLRFAAAPVKTPKINFSTYKQVDVRRVQIDSDPPELFGQIIIAYKEEKTETAEIEAMIRAIVEASSITEPIEEIEKSRASDYAERVAIWDACVAESKCSNDTK